MTKSTEAPNFTQRVAQAIISIPAGCVASYGQIAAMAGDPRGARQVVRLLHTASDSLGLPWHRVVDGEGCIVLPQGGGYEEQQSRLEAEGVFFRADDRIDMLSCQWHPAEPPPGSSA